MNAVTVITLTVADLEAMMDRVVKRAVIESAESSGVEWSVDDVAAHLGVSGRTVLRMEARGELPKRAGRRWRKVDVLRCRKEAAEA
jgi:hypothetical protein